MSIYYSTKNLKSGEFIVVKHSLPKYEGDVYGVTFRGGFGVVVKDSKAHQNLKRIRPKAVVQEYPLKDLSKLPFVINDKQIEYIWGKAVYSQYKLKKKHTPQVEAMNKANEQADKCSVIKKDGENCKGPVFKDSEFCRNHIVLDSRIKEQYEALPMMPKKQKKAAIKKLIEEYIKG